MGRPKTFRDYELIVKIRNNYIVITSEDFGLTYSGGPLENFSLEGIGSAIMKTFHGVMSEIAKGSQGVRPEKFLTVGEAAEFLQVSRSTTRRLIAAGKIQSVWTEGGHRRINSRFLEGVIKKMALPCAQGEPKSAASS